MPPPSVAICMSIAQPGAFKSSFTKGRYLAVGETVILLHPSPFSSCFNNNMDGEEMSVK